MTTSSLLRAAMLWLALITYAGTARAAASDYGFEAVAVDVAIGPNSEIRVRLVHKPTGKPVQGALIVKTRLDMAPDDMEAMTASHSAAEPTGEPGIYRFKADLTMEGRWALKLLAKIQGEPETVIGTVIFKAKN